MVPAFSFPLRCGWAGTSREAGGGDGGDVVVRSGGPQVWLRVGPCLDSRGSVVDRVRHSV